MRLALCLIVKDEINRIGACLDPVAALFDDIVVIDTGSTDGTPQLLRERFGIDAIPGVLREDQCFSKCEERNRGFELARADWVVALDADEAIGPDAVRRLRAAAHAGDADGFFGAWINHFEGEPAFEDYKLFAFRKGFRKRGLVHDNVQTDLRERGARARWLEGLTVDHHPETAKLPHKLELYRWRLERAIGMEPHWLRYHWFLGYMDYQAHRWDASDALLAQVTEGAPGLFPVECLNSYMVRIDIAARRGRRQAALELCDAALAFHEQVSDDFEVPINFRLLPWLREARARAEDDDLDAIRAYRFAR
ncbi:MAG: glycosyltransferase [Burkholderiales bacterium]|nr:MAG: glycosyltransferase [Burkholderiales bacterium]